MSKRYKYIGIGIVLMGVLVCSKPAFQTFVNTDTVVNRIGCRLFEFNTISVRTDADVDINQVQLKINDQVVFEDGQQQNRIGQTYGQNVFEIYYSDLLISEVGHFRTNNWYTNQYAFSISKDQHELRVAHQIKGPDASNDNFQKRYVYDDAENLIRIDYLNEEGEVYRTDTRL